MKTFLSEVIKKLISNYHFEKETICVFPTHRSIFSFRQEFYAHITKPTLFPSCVTSKDFILSHSSLVVPDRLDLITRLYSVYTRLKPSSESFDTFYFLGDLLLRDFNEIDKHQINAAHLYKELANQKEIDNTFYYLTQDQREKITQFWNHTLQHPNEYKMEFTRFWKKLFLIYQAFQKSLMEQGLAYEGMIYRQVADEWSTKISQYTDKKLHFIGLNELTKVEKSIIKQSLEQGIATIHWDEDEYYVGTDKQEAGLFLRAHRQDQILGKTFNPTPSSYLRKKEKIHTYDVTYPISQAKLLAHILRNKIPKEEEDKTAIILPDENLLLPVLHAISGLDRKWHLTMGLSLMDTPIYNLFESILDIQRQSHKKSLHYKTVLSVLNHPYIQKTFEPSMIAQCLDEIRSSKKKFIPELFFKDKGFSEHLFSVWSATEKNPWSCLQELSNTMFPSIVSCLDGLDQQYVLHFHNILNRLLSVQKGWTLPSDTSDGMKNIQSLSKLVRTVIHLFRVPFSDNSLSGLQIMGILDTRCLDFKNVFILSATEGFFPMSTHTSSCIPHGLRRAFSLPTYEHRDAIYAYSFYRVIQRATNVHIFYPSCLGEMGKEEQSRFIKQLKYESDIPIINYSSNYELHRIQPTPVSITKSRSILNVLINRFTQHPLSPSSLTMYLECPLQFYFWYVVRARDVEPYDDAFMDEKTLGVFFHEVMNRMYKDDVRKTLHSMNIENKKKVIETLMNEVLEDVFSLLHQDLTGEQFIIWEVVKKITQSILQMDRDYAPFTISAVEQDFLNTNYTVRVPHLSKYVQLNGKVDRVDEKNKVIRIIDYKTGSDTGTFQSISSLFDQSVNKQNKAVFQLLVYTLLFYKKNNTTSHILKPTLLSTKNIFGKTNTERQALYMGKKRIDDASEILEEFEDHLIKLIQEIFDPDIPFDQTLHKDRCLWCSYKELCNR